MKDLLDEIINMDRDKLNCAITVVVDHGNPKVEMEGNAAAVLISFQAYAASIIKCGWFNDTSRDDLVTALHGAVDLAEILANRHKDADGK